MASEKLSTTLLNCQLNSFLLFWLTDSVDGAAVLEVTLCPWIIEASFVVSVWSVLNLFKAQSFYMCWPMCVHVCMCLFVCVWDRECLCVSFMTCTNGDEHKWKLNCCERLRVKIAFRLWQVVWTVGIWKKKNKNQVWILKATKLGQAPELLVAMEG